VEPHFGSDFHLVLYKDNQNGLIWDVIFNLENNLFHTLFLEYAIHGTREL